MNERIWELFRQANHPHPKHDGNDMFFPEEFAELIVKECCNLVREIDAMEIRKHFGVE